MAIKKSELYSSLWFGCDELRGGMDASQYKDYVLALLFVKYVSDRYVGRRLLKENLQDARAAYGKQILATVSRELRDEFGDGFTLRSLYRSIQFFVLFPDEAIVSTLSAQLSWSHFEDLKKLGFKA